MSAGILIIGCKFISDRNIKKETIAKTTGVIIIINLPVDDHMILGALDTSNS